MFSNSGDTKGSVLCTDTNDNLADFTGVAPAPRNSASPAVTCAAPPPPPPPPATNEFAAELVDRSAPASLAPGAEADVWFDFKNTGTATWKPGATRLGTDHPHDRAIFLEYGSGRQRMLAAFILNRQGIGTGGIASGDQGIDLLHDTAARCCFPAQDYEKIRHMPAPDRAKVKSGALRPRDYQLGFSTVIAR